MQDGNDGNDHDDNRNDDELRLKEIASEVVQDVLRQAPHTAMERFTTAQQLQKQQRLGELENLREDEDEDEIGDLPPLPPNPIQTKYGNQSLQRLPTIQIDTVPSPPRSPTDWPSPPPEEEDIREEEDDELREDHIELSFEDGAHEQREDVHKYAANYIDNLVDKAVELAEERQIAEDTERAREIAAKVVEDVVSLASETASRKSAASLIHAVKFKDAPKQLQEFAKSYIKDVIARAVTVAEEKAVHSSPFNFDDGDLIKTNGPWYIRVREAFIRVLRTACFCTPRRNDS